MRSPHGAFLRAVAASALAHQPMVAGVNAVEHCAAIVPFRRPLRKRVDAERLAELVHNPDAQQLKVRSWAPIPRQLGPSYPARHAPSSGRPAAKRPG